MANTPLKLTGIALPSAYVDDFLETQPPVAWIDVDAEPHYADGGKAVSQLTDLRKACPVSLRSNALSLASTDDLNWQTLSKLRALTRRIDACLVSEPLAWSSVNGHFLHQSLPFPYTEETLAHLIERVKQVQSALSCQFLIENCTQFMQFEQSTLSEASFLKHLAEETGCGLLLNLTNVYASANNLDFNPSQYISTLNRQHIQAIHLRGFTTTNINGNPLLLPTREQPLVPAIWDLFSETIKQVGAKPTLIQWESHTSNLADLTEAAYHAETLMRETYVATKLAG